MNYTAKEAIEKITAWEDEHEIRINDVVKNWIPDGKPHRKSKMLCDVD